MLGLILNRGVAFLLVPFYARALEPSVFAKLDLCMTTVLFLAPLFELGMASAMLRFFHLYEDPEERLAATRTSFTFILLAVSAFTALVLGVANVLSVGVFGDEAGASLIRLVGLTAAITVVGNQVLALLRAQEKSVSFAILNLVRSLVGPAAIILLVVRFDLGLYGVLWGEIAGLGVMMIAGIVMCRRWFGLTLSGKALREMLAFGLPLLPMGLSTPIITMSDRYFLRIWVGFEELAVYSLGFKIAMIVTLLTRAFQTAWPAAAYQIAKEEDATRSIADIFRIVVVGISAMALFLSVAAPELVQIVGGRAIYMPARAIVPWIAFSYAVYLCVLYVLTSLTIANKTGAVFLVVSGGCIAKILLNLALIKTYGTVGAAVSTLAAFAVELIVGYAVAQRIYPVPYPLRRILLFTIAVTASAVGAWSASRLSLGLSLALRVLVLAAFPVAAFGTGMIHRSELRSVWRSIAPRIERFLPGRNPSP
ncbi:MAG TPA: oligosaccharide flippase family protein [Candidatus Hydrogenedentes bacterium]|nr:oligosaccharide flippase family protein [Candidatus Hydrogenedentota bacterium]